MWPRLPQPVTPADEAKRAHLYREQRTEHGLRNSIFMARGNARFLVKVIRSAHRPAESAMRTEALRGLLLNRIDCRVAAHTLRLMREKAAKA